MNLKTSNIIKIKKSKNPKKKYTAIFELENKKVNFGASGYSDYTIHKNKNRKDRYISRHKKREDWTVNGKYTAGFWSRWLLWHQPSLRESARDIEKMLKRKIKLDVTPKHD